MRSVRQRRRKNFCRFCIGYDRWQQRCDQRRVAGNGHAGPIHHLNGDRPERQHVGILRLHSSYWSSTDADADTDADSYSNGDAYSYSDSDGDSDTYANRDADTYSDTDSNTDTDADADADGDAYSYSNTDADADAGDVFGV